MLATCLFCGERTQQTDAWCTLTKAFACNGNVKKAEDDQNVKEAKSGQNRVIILQGNHCQDLKEFLMNEQVPAAKIRMHNF